MVHLIIGKANIILKSNLIYCVNCFNKLRGFHGNTLKFNR